MDKLNYILLRLRTEIINKNGNTLDKMNLSYVNI